MAGSLNFTKIVYFYNKNQTFNFWNFQPDKYLRSFQIRRFITFYCLKYLMLFLRKYKNQTLPKICIWLYTSSISFLYFLGNSHHVLVEFFFSPRHRLWRIWHVSLTVSWVESNGTTIHLVRIFSPASRPFNIDLAEFLYWIYF